jgi:formamidopyrimidine-DNA glycosylase
VPELPEVEVLRRDLEKEVVGRRMKDVTIKGGPNAKNLIKRHAKRKDVQDLLDGAKIEKVDRVGKKIILGLDNTHAMLLDLGSSGILLKTSASDPVEPHTHLTLGFTIGGQLRIVDPAREAELYVAPLEQIEGLEELRAHLIDPLEQQFAWQRFSQLLEERDDPMKDLLMNPEFICGLGDLYSDEVLWMAAIRPDRRSSKLTSQDVRRLYRALMEILQEAIKARGTSVGDAPFRDLQGQPGQYQAELKVYGKEGGSCRRCRNVIAREEFGGHTSFYCPQCQP